MSCKALAERIIGPGMEPIGSTVAQCTELMRNKRTRCGDIIKVTGSAGTLHQ